jgi:hypothetical protein
MTTFEFIENQHHTPPKSFPPNRNSYIPINRQMENALIAGSHLMHHFFSFDPKKLDISESVVFESV